MFIAFIGFTLFFAAYAPTSNLIFYIIRPVNLETAIPSLTYIVPALLAYAALKVHPISAIVKGKYKGKKEIIVGAVLIAAFLLIQLVIAYSGYGKRIEVNEVVAIALALAHAAGQFLVLVGLFKLVLTPHTN